MKGLSRREFIALAAGGALTARTSVSGLQSPRTLYAFVGSTTQGAFGAGGGGGIHVFRVGMADGSLTRVAQTGPEMDGLVADGLCISPNGRFLYAVDEKRNLGGNPAAGGGVVAFAINPANGSLAHLNTQPSMGVNPAYVTIDGAGSRVLVANHGQSNQSVIQIVKNAGVPKIENLYDDGTVAMFMVMPDGSLEPACDVDVFERKPGTASNSLPTGQAHSVNFDPSGRFALACDVGTDHLYIYRIDQASRSLGAPRIVPTEPGKAPRFSAFHPRRPYVFIVNEREPSMSSFRFDSATGEVRHVQTVATIADGYSGPRVAPSDVHIHPNGRFVYGSNRGDDSIAIFQIDETTGRLSRVDVVKTQGANPRGFSFEPSGTFLIVGNQGSNTLVTFAVDPNSGRMTPTGARADLPRPACVRFAAI